MFEFLSCYDTVLVCGPQRSGTRICAKMIAHDTGKVFVDEEEFGVDNTEAFHDVLDKRQGIVVQCPAMTHHVHNIMLSNIAVVFMWRDLREISASQERIRWGFNDYELRKYGIYHGGMSAEIKQRCWTMFQKRLIRYSFDVHYNGLADHTLWVDPDKRREFTYNQTEVIDGKQ